jgi:hypothetical protein
MNVGLGRYSIMRDAVVSLMVDINLIEEYLIKWLHLLWNLKRK